MRMIHRREINKKNDIKYINTNNSSINISFIANQ